jgi:predicted nucleic acid-binding protein
MPDAVIGATALGLSATLFTFNARDFKAIKGLDFQAPYAR